MLMNDATVVADIGAGTGRFTEMIAQVGYDVFAVEPNMDMYEQLKLTLKGKLHREIVITLYTEQLT